MNIPLNLRRHCIETEIRRCYNHCLSRYFKSGADKPRLEQQIEMLRHALEQWDFRYLRSRCPELSGCQDAKIFLSADADGGITLRIDGRRVSPYASD